MTQPSPARAVAALMPCHIEPPALELLFHVRAHVDEVLLVDDGMPEIEAAELDRVALGIGVGVLHLPHRGKGHAVAAGLASLEQTGGAAAVVLVDSDGQHPPDAIPRFLESSRHADLVIGDRFSRGAAGPPLRRLANRVANFVIGKTTGFDVPDSQCGMRLLTRRALLEVRFEGGRFEAETVHLRRCLRAGVPVAWIPIPAIYGRSPSAFRPIRDSIAVLAACFGRQASHAPRGRAWRRRPRATRA